MREHPYDPNTIEQPYRSLFDQLANEFTGYEVWQRYENFDRWLSAALVEATTGKALTVPVIHANVRRTWLFHPSEIEIMRREFASATPSG